jgi:hypothetical protein
VAAFELYATADWTLERLTAELAARGLWNRGRRDYPPKPLSLGGVAKLLANKTYMGLIDWNGVLVQGQHQPLISPDLFQQVQDLLAARSARGTRERKHHHYLKGVLHCAVCARRYSYLVATGKSGRRYPYFYCLGTRRPWRLPRTPHPRRPAGRPGRTALRANPTPPPLAHRATGRPQGRDRRPPGPRRPGAPAA